VATETGPDLEAGRLAVEAMMDDSCEIRRPAGKAAIDPVTLMPTGAAGALVYSGPCILSLADTQPSEQAVAEGTSPTVARYVLKVPVGSIEAAGARSGDVVLMTSSRRDPAMSGQRLLVEDVAFKTMGVVRRIPLVRRVTK
jgi:hypothetical protein